MSSVNEVQLLCILWLGGCSTREELCKELCNDIVDVWCQRGKVISLCSAAPKAVGKYKKSCLNCKTKPVFSFHFADSLIEKE